MGNKWTIRANNSLLYDGDDQYWLVPEDKYELSTPLKLVLTCLDQYTKFPYMDSFRYFNPDTLELCCNCPSYGYVALSNTDGYWERGEERCCARCGDCETIYDDDEGDFVWSDYEDAWLCPDCRIWIEWIEDYVSADTNMVVVTDNDKEVDLPRSFVIDNTTAYDDNNAFADFVQLPNGVYYTMDSVNWSSEDNRYIINE
jgi:rubredoxin